MCSGLSKIHTSLLQIYFTKKELSNSNIISFSVQEYEDQEKLKEFLRNLANATYENFREMTDIPNNPIKSDDYLNAIVQVSIVTYLQLLNHDLYKIDSLKLMYVFFNIVSDKKDCVLSLLLLCQNTWSWYCDQHHWEGNLFHI